MLLVMRKLAKVVDRHDMDVLNSTDNTAFVQIPDSTGYIRIV